MMTGFGMGFGIIGLLIILLFLGILIAGGIIIIKFIITISQERENNIAPKGISTSLDILDQRYARGEISREEYNQIKSDLM